MRSGQTVVFHYDRGGCRGLSPFLVDLNERLVDDVRNIETFLATFPLSLGRC